MSVAAISGMGSVLPVQPALVRIDRTEQVVALGRLAVTTQVAPEQLAVALGISVKELAAAVHAYQSALRALVASAGYWVPGLGIEAGALTPRVTVGARQPTVLVVPEAQRGTAPVPPLALGQEHVAYRRSAELAPARLGAGPVQLGLAVQVGKGPARFAFLVDRAVADPAGALSRAVHGAVVSAAGGTGAAVVLAEVAGPRDTAARSVVPSVVVEAGATDVARVAGKLAESGSVPTATASAPSQAAATSQGAAAVAQASTTMGAQAGHPQPSGQSAPGVSAQAVPTPVDLGRALDVARQDPQVGYRAWPSDGRSPEQALAAVPGKDALPVRLTAAAPAEVADLARLAAPAKPAVQFASPTAIGGQAVAESASAAAGSTAAQVAAMIDAAADGDAGAPVVLVASGRAVPLGIEAAVAQPDQVLRLVLDLGAVLRPMLDPAAVLPPELSRMVDQSRLAELLAAAAAGADAAPRPRRRRTAGGEPEPAENWAEHFFAALFTTRILDDLRDLEVDTLLVAPDHPDVEALLRLVADQHVAVHLHLGDLPGVEVLEVVRID